MLSLCADLMLGKGKLAELRVLARTHKLAVGSQTVPNSVVEIAAAQGRSPPKGSTPPEALPAPQRKKLILRKPKRKTPQVVQEDEEEDDEATEDGLITERRRVAPPSPSVPPALPTPTPPSPQLQRRQSKQCPWRLHFLRLRPTSPTSWRTLRAPPRHSYPLERVLIK